MRYQRKYCPQSPLALPILSRSGGGGGREKGKGKGQTHLARADLVKTNKSKSLRHHRGRQVPFRHHEGNQHRGEEELRDESQGLGAERGELRGGAARA